MTNGINDKIAHGPTKKVGVDSCNARSLDAEAHIALQGKAFEIIGNLVKFTVHVERDFIDHLSSLVRPCKEQHILAQAVEVLELLEVRFQHGFVFI
ncbi:hypothetical protein [Rhizobium yanglingense]